MQHHPFVIIGGGAAGYFAAIACAQAFPSCSPVLLEKSRRPLAKVKVSGGGRCNVTHACFDPSLLIKNYPRGSNALRGPFTRFQPRDTVEWFESRGVALKKEEDGRMFPVTDSSETIIRCLESEARKSGVEVRVGIGVEGIRKVDNGFIIDLAEGEMLSCEKLLLATGSNSTGLQWAEALGHRIVPPVPSLFTFNIPHSPLEELAGVSVPDVIARIENTSLEQRGPLLITHWGFSGPAILKLSAWGARILHESGYQATLVIDWLPTLNIEQVKIALMHTKETAAARLAANECPFSLPRQLWKKLLLKAGVPSEARWAVVTKQHIQKIVEELHSGKFSVQGKSTYKEEFVTCGGVMLDDVNFKTMESKRCSGLYFAGEVLDIDGVTGGFNFQNAWTTGWIAGNAMSTPS